MYVSMHACMYVCVCICVFVCVCVRMYAIPHNSSSCMYVSICVCMGAYLGYHDQHLTYIHTHVHTCIHTYIHTYTCIPGVPWPTSCALFPATLDFGAVDVFLLFWPILAGKTSVNMTCVLAPTLAHSVLYPSNALMYVCMYLCVYVCVGWFVLCMYVFMCVCMCRLVCVM